MKYRQRTFYTDSQKSEMWDRWQRGESLSSIGRPKFGQYGWEPSTARYTDSFTRDKVNALIDHIMVSIHLIPTNDSAARVWNPFQLDEAKPHKPVLLNASDHFPVTLDIE